jgi:hypothetical protein
LDATNTAAGRERTRVSHDLTEYHQSPRLVQHYVTDAHELYQCQPTRYQLLLSERLWKY